MKADDLGEEQPRSVTYVKQRILERMVIVKVSRLTDRNIVTTSINTIGVANIYNIMAKTTKPFSTFMGLIGTRECALQMITDDLKINHPNWQNQAALNTV